MADRPASTGRTPRWGLCCQFADAPIKFRQATHRYVSSLDADAGRRYLADIARDNAAALAAAIQHCAAIGIGAFRISSQLLPIATHPVSGYALGDLPDGDALVAAFRDAGRRAAALDVRLSFHPDQFIVLNSERELTVQSALRDLELTASLCELLGADAMTVHGGGMAGGKNAALERLARGIDRLSPRARAHLALENDDRLFTPTDLLPLCEASGVALVYDVHHHRCHPDALDVAAATDAAAATWGAREPWTHLASPRDGWTATNPRPHAGMADPTDFPLAWLGRRMTIDVEAKEKERAVLAIRAAVAALPAAASACPARGPR